jgi:hypothetical protein
MLNYLKRESNEHGSGHNRANGLDGLRMERDDMEMNCGRLQASIYQVVKHRQIIHTERYGVWD